MVTSKGQALWVGFSLGVSFGLGEAAYVAYSVAKSGLYECLPWYAFTGYLSERLFVCFAHGVMTAVLVTGVQRGGRFALYGILAAMGLHLILNAPAVMYQFEWITLAFYNFVLLIPLFVLALIFERMRRAAREPDYIQAENEIVYWQRRMTG
jgi:hypothetical protein